jgi:signal transduction histidine kinase
MDPSRPLPSLLLPRGASPAGGAPAFHTIRRLGLGVAALLCAARPAAAQPAATASPASPREYEGLVTYNDPAGTAGEVLYYFKYVQDSVLVLGEGFAGEPRVTLPHEAFANLLRVLHHTGALRDTTALRYAVEAQFAPAAPDALAVSAQAPVLPVVTTLVLGVAVVLGVALHRRVRRERTERVRERALRLRLAEAREAERAHFARELHDGPIQDLCAVQLALAALAPHGDGRADGRAQGTATAEEGAEVARQAVTTVVADLRGLCDRLRPPSLDAFGLPTALEALAQRFSRQHPDLRVDLRVEAAAPASVLSSDLQLALFRIAQEALTNAARHARASRAEIALALTPSTFALSVDDDGTGPPAGDPLDYAREGHYGLLGMRERADLVGATLRVDRSPLGGTRVAVARAAGAVAGAMPVFHAAR